MRLGLGLGLPPGPRGIGVAAAVLASFTYQGSHQREEFANPLDIGSVDIGDDDPNRVIVLFVSWMKPSSNRTLDSVSVNGAAATVRLRSEPAAHTRNTEIWTAKPTGSGVVTVTLTFNGGMAGTGLLMSDYRLVGYAEVPTQTAELDGSSANQTALRTLLIDDAVVQQSAQYSTSGHVTFSLVGTNEDVTMQNMHVANGYYPCSAGHHKAVAGDLTIGRSGDAGTKDWKHLVGVWSLL